MHVVWVNEKADFSGGAERYVGDTARHMRARGIRNTLLYGVDGWTEPAFTSQFDAAFPLVDGPRQVRELGADVLYVHQWPSTEEVIALRQAGRPVLRFFHDHALLCLRDHKYTTVGHRTCSRTIGPNCYPCLGFVNRSEQWPGVRLRTVSKLKRKLHAHRQLDGIVVGSSYMKTHLQAHGFSADRVHIAQPFVERPPPMEAPIARQAATMLFVGGLVRGKGVDLLIDALPDLSDVQLKIVGRGRQRPDYEQQVERLGLGQRVEFLGSQTRPQLERLYHQASAVVVPSRSPETFGLVGPEALVRGCPVIAAAVGGMGEWLLDGVTGYAVPSGDAQALRKAIAHVVAHPEQAQRLAEQGRKRCLERFTPEQHLERLLPLLERMALKERAA